MLTCSICSGGEFQQHRILWPALIAEWELRPHEVDYIDRQQGRACVRCGANLRAVALGRALQGVFATDLPLNIFVNSADAADMRLLEVNEAHNLTVYLRHLPGHVLAAYPDVDLTKLPFGDGSFDVVVHSDTLEHIPDPLQGLRECLRVLRPGGALCFSVPTIVERLTRSRAGLPRSFHGNPANAAEHFLVHTEFGADVWTFVARAGFERIELNVVNFPDAMAITAIRDDAGSGWRDARARSEAAHGRIAVLEAELRAVRSSRSWRATAPMRALGHRLRSWLRT